MDGFHVTQLPLSMDALQSVAWSEHIQAGLSGFWWLQLWSVASRF